MVIALAGRRIDLPGTDQSRFPESNIGVVRERIFRYLEASRATVLVCAAACGADLLGLESARRLGMRRRIVLPSSAAIFRQTSVADRPGNWIDIFNTLVMEAEETGDFVVLEEKGGDQFSATNSALLEEALRLGAKSGQPVQVVAVWEAQRKAGTDYTAQFVQAARKLGLAVHEISTLR